MKKALAAMQRQGLLVLLLLTLAALQWDLGRARAMEESRLRSTVSDVMNRVRPAAQQLDLTMQERRVEDMGWLFDMDEARAAASRLGRPIFLFIMDGELNGRC